MKLTDITKQSVKKVSNKELVSLHHRLHQLFTVAISRKSSKELIEFLIKVHNIIAGEMKKRNLQHRTPIPESHYSLELFLQDL